jgi:hypothetical protein
VLEILLPRTDAGVLVQVIATVALGGLSLSVLIRRRKPDIAWFVGGVVTIWVAFLGIRTLH